MIKYILELIVGDNLIERTMEADGAAIQDGSNGFVVFYKVTGVNENGEEIRKTLRSYNLTSVFSLGPEDD